jgi:phage tail-like protein
MPAPQFFVNVNRIDPYKNFKFRVKFDGNVVAGVSKVGALTRKTEVVSHREGNDPMNGKRHSPGPTNFEPVTLERGLSFAPEFEAWAMKVYSPDGDSAVSLKNFRQRVTIDLLNLQGIVVRSYTLLRCWVSDYTAMAELDANGNGINFESITVHHEGFVRDDVPEVPET